MAAPVVSANNVARSYLQLLARDEGSAAAATPNIMFPDNAQLKFSLAAEGSQNYTCDPSTSTWVNVGALAHLSNSSLEYDPSKLVGFHYFVNETGTLSPEWDLSRSQPDNDGNNFVVASKIGQFASPDGPQNVPWLLVQGNQGGLARFVMRAQTKGGVPHTPNCDPNQSAPLLVVPYTSIYIFFD
ncbi:hypothetical protein NQZ79_g77 [Umbelopsis isabellina]|nr:hypothetical protein NQZ79_g77 [Umbelopsis isabellina]